MEKRRRQAVRVVAAGIAVLALFPALCVAYVFHRAHLTFEPGPIGAKGLKKGVKPADLILR